MNTPTPADARQRAQLEHQRARLITQARELSKQTIQLWRKIHVECPADEELLQLKTMLDDVEETCLRISQALLAISNELNEDEEE